MAARVRAIGLLALCAALVGAFLDGPAAHAQGDGNDYVDVAVFIESPDAAATYNYPVSVIVVNHGSRTAYDVEVVVEVEHPEESRFFTVPSVPVGFASVDDNGSLRWSISALAGMQRKEGTAEVWVEVFPSLMFGASYNNEKSPHKVVAEVTTSSFESSIHKGNNTDQVWSYNYGTNNDRFIEAGGNYKLAVSVDQPVPSPGDTVNFTITTGREGVDQYYKENVNPGITAQDTPPINLKIDIELTSGLSDTGTPTYAVGFLGNTNLIGVPGSWRYRNGALDVGTLDSPFHSDLFVTLPMEVASDAVVNQQCLTATLTGDPPPGTGPIDDDISDNVAKVCLGEPPVEQVIFTHGHTDLFTWYDCVGKSSYPCSNEDSLEIVVLGMSASAASGAPYGIFEPGKVVVHVPDPAGRDTSSEADSSALVWSTGFREDPDVIGDERFARDGVSIGDNQTLLAPGKWGVEPTGETDERTGTLIKSVSGPGAVSAWGIYDTRNGYASFEFVSKAANGEMWNDVWYLQYRNDIWYEFSALGTYEVTYSATANLNKGTISDTSDDTAHTATATYTFHVGPVAELEVAYALRQVLPDGRLAIDVIAANNGPDRSEGAEVRLTLQAGATIDSADSRGDGSYRAGVWTLPEFEHRDWRASARMPETATLSLVVDPAGVTGPFTMSGEILNTAPYVVTIDGTEHRGTVYDHVDANNRFEATLSRDDIVAGTHPALTGLAITSTPTPQANGPGSYLPGDVIEVSARFSKDVRVTGYPALRLQIGDEVQEAQYASGSGTDTLRFHYTVGQWDRDDNGVSIPANPFVLRGNPIRDGDGNDAMLDFAGLGDQAGHRVGGPDTPQTRPEPQAIGRLTATARDGAVDLEWPAVPDTDKVFYQLWRNDDPTWWQISPRIVGSSRLGYTVTDLENGTEYIFRVRAHYKYEHGDTPGPPSAPALATPTGPPTPVPGQPSGPNTPPEFDRATAWPDTPYCVNAGAGSGTEVARVKAHDQDGDRLQFYRRSGFDEIADNHFTVSTVKSGDAYWGVIRVSRTIPRNLEDKEGFEGFIIIDLEVTDGRGGLDQIGVDLRYDPSSRNCQEATSRSTASGESGASALATVKTTFSGWMRESGAAVRNLFDAVGRLPGSVRWSWMTLQDEDPTAATQEVRPPPD